MPSILCLQANNYLATVTLKEGKVYAFFVKSPAKVEFPIVHLTQANSSTDRILKIANVTAAWPFL